MKVKALRTFGGQYAMIKNHVADLPENRNTEILLQGRYIERLKVNEKAEAKVNEKAEESEEAEKETMPDLEAMKKDELVQLAEDMRITVPTRITKDELIDIIRSRAGGEEGGD